MADNTDTDTDSSAPPAFPPVAVRRQRRPSPVWLIPFAAAVIGVWLLVQYWQQRGEAITVHFPNAEGIQAGSTEVRYKAVTVGRVKQVTLDESLNPLVTLSLSKSISDSLNCSAQFWVVRPRIRGTEVSGLGTLFSGTYVGMLPSQSEEDSEDSILCYEVLDGPPATKPERPGREFSLITESMGSLDIGTPVFFKQLRVGEITNYRLSEQTGKVELDIFVDQPYYRFIKPSTRFWNASGAEFTMDSVGAEFRMESIASLLVGGISFETPPDSFADKLPVSAEGDVFELFPDYASSQEKRYEDRLYYTLYFNGSLRGLADDAPVEFNGIKVGQVEKIKMHLDHESLDVRIPVLVSIEPQRFSESIRRDEAPAFMQDLVSRGMRAKLQTASFMTGQMYIGLVFDEKAEADEITEGQFYAVFPTSPTPTEELTKLAMDVADDVKVTLGSISGFMESKQLDKTVENLNQVLSEIQVTVATARDVLDQVDQKTLPQFNDSLTQVSSGMDRVLKQVDEETLPAVTDNLNQIGADVNRVVKRVDEQTLPTVARSLNQITEDVGKVTKRVDEQTLPTVARTLNQVSQETSQVLKQVNDKTLPEVSRLSNTATDSLTRVTGTVNKASTDFSRSTYELNKTLTRLQNTLGHLDRMLARNSPTQHQLAELMEEMTAMARSVRILTEQLERQPDSVLRGKKELK